MAGEWLLRMWQHTAASVSKHESWGSQPARLAVAASAFHARVFLSFKEPNIMKFYRLKKYLKWQNTFLVCLVLVLIGVRIALPQMVQRYVNRVLDEMPEYAGHVGDVDMKLWKGAYEINDIEIIKTTGKIPVPFFAAKVVKFSVEWKALFDGAWVGEIEFDSPVINFVNGASESTTQVGVDKPWLDVITRLFPLDLNRFEVRNGTMHYRDFHSHPKVDLKIDQIHMLGKNFTNSQKLSKKLAADIQAKGRAFDEGQVDLVMQINPFTRHPTFSLDFKLSPVPITRFNDFARAYANFDFEKGTLAITSELNAVDGSMKGYLKPLMDKVAIVDVKEDVKHPLKLVWEGLVGSVTRLFRNQRKERFATVIPLAGRVDDPKASVLPMIGNIFHNAFVRAYGPNFEHMVPPANDGKK